MHLLLQIIAGFLITRGVLIVIKILTALGIGVFVYKNVDIAVSALKTHLVASSAGVSSDLVSILSMSGFGVYLSLVVSAYIAAITVRATLGGFKSIRFIGTGG